MGARVRCALCPHDCIIADGGRGACGVRYDDRGRLYTLVYDKVVAGRWTSWARLQPTLDPIRLYRRLGVWIEVTTPDRPWSEPAAVTMFADRMDAGRRLARAAALQAGSAGRPRLPRGGVPVGFEVARIPEAPLDLLLVRKIGVPGYPELALGAVLDGEHPHLVLNPDLADLANINASYIAEQEAQKLKEIEERRALYLRGRRRPLVAGRTAIVVDDGVATGSTMMAAIEALREMAVGRLVVAVPVAPPDTAESLRARADELVCLATPAAFRAVGQFYADFEQTTDAEVIALLDQAAALGADQATREPSARE